MGGKSRFVEPGGIIRVRVIPRAKVNAVADVFEDGRIKIRLTAPPVDGKANKSLVIFLSTILDVPRSSIEIISGSKGRDKVIRVNGLDQDSIDSRIKDWRT
jgi:uncharacterized protein (TIGR00251 family)